MTNAIFFRYVNLWAVLLMIAASLSLVVSSCSDDDELTGDPYFTIEESPTGLATDAKGTTKSYVVRSNRPWQVQAQGEQGWVRAFPTEGTDDGIFKFIVSANATFEGRTTNFSFVVNGVEQPVLFRVEQAPSVPTLNVPATVEALAAGGDVSIDVDANLAWTYELDAHAPWLTAVAPADKKILLRAEKNAGPERSATIWVRSADYPSLDKSIEIHQLPGSIVLRENFNWLTYGNVLPYETGGEIRMDLWKPEELNHGWTSTPVSISSNQPMLYARPGFVKLGKTGVGGDLISPKLNITGTVKIKVTFKAAAYISAAGAIDDRILKVYALGTGTVSVPQFTIDNVPNYKTQDDANIKNDIWAEDRAYSFVVTGATKDTQIKFLGGDYNLAGVGQGKNRIFLDDISIEIIE